MRYSVAAVLLATYRSMCVWVVAGLCVCVTDEVKQMAAVKVKTT